MSKSVDAALKQDIDTLVRRMLEEDVGSGDLTAQLINEDTTIKSRVITREPMVLCGRPWAEALFTALDAGTKIEWRADDGETLPGNATVFSLQGPARPVLTAERSVLNILQSLSATATVTAEYVAAVAGTGCRILDTRKTIPGLRLAQKYAVRCGGGTNHRTGLFDAILIKENHILAAGGIGAAVERSRSLHPGIPVEVEVESLDQLDEAISASVDQVLLDNFNVEQLREAVRVSSGRTRLEASGNVSLETIREIAETGVDFVSVGALTKHVRAIDLSMRFE